MQAFVRQNRCYLQCTNKQIHRVCYIKVKKPKANSSCINFWLLASQRHRGMSASILYVKTTLLKVTAQASSATSKLPVNACTREAGSATNRCFIFCSLLTILIFRANSEVSLCQKSPALKSAGNKSVGMTFVIKARLRCL